MTATEAKMHQILKVWEPLTAIPDAKDLADLNHPLFPMFARLYELLHAQCSRMPKRKNGEPWFIHPLNVVTNIKYAGNSDLLTHCIALMHDYIEDEIDLYQLQQGIVANQSGFSILAQRHHQVMLDLTSAVKGLCSDSQVQTLLGAVDGLTRKNPIFICSPWLEFSSFQTKK